MKQVKQLTHPNLPLLGVGLIVFLTVLGRVWLIGYTDFDLSWFRTFFEFGCPNLLSHL